MSLNSSEGQWIYLGVHFEACVVDPEMFGTAGGAISMWLRVFGPQGGIVSTLTHQSQSLNAGGFEIFLIFNKLG